MNSTVSKLFRVHSSITVYVAAILFAAILGSAVALYGSRTQSAEAADCDANAIIYCGTNQSDLVREYNSLNSAGKQAFSLAGASNPGSCNTVMGSVTRTNKVVLNNGKQVADSAYTYGRQYIPGSDTIIPNQLYGRAPSVSFRSSSIPAIICMQNGIFKWAVITTCGNPVKANPTPDAPKLAISKTSAQQVVKVGEDVKYEITIRNTGNVTAVFPTITDLIPRDAKYVSHYDANAEQSGYWNGAVMVNPKGGIRHEAHDPDEPHVKVVFASLLPGQSKTISMRVQVVRDYNSDDKICNIANVRAVKYPDQPSNRVCDEIKKEPSAVCKKLTATPAIAFAPAQVTLKAQGEVSNGATITGYRFRPGDGSGAINTPNDSITHTYTQPGDYTASVVIDTSVGPRTGEACEVPVKVKAVVNEPTFDCKSLSAQPNQGVAPLTVNFTAVADNPDNLEITNYAFNFGDGTDVEGNDPTVSHAYAAGEYTASVVITAKDAQGRVFTTNPNDCKAPIRVEEGEEPEFACERLNMATVDDDGELPFNVSFNADASASDGAVIQQYLWNFGDGQTAQTAGDTTNHAYTRTGTFTATVRVQTNLGTTPVSAACSKTVTVTDKQPTFECKDLTVQPQSGEAPLAVVFTATGEVDGAVIESYTFSFGDNTTDVTTANNTTNHTYQVAGDYTATVSIKTNLGVTNPQDCKVSITATKKPVCPYNPQLPPDHPDCKKSEQPCPYNPNLPKDSPDCKEDELPVGLPTVLPKTGAGQAVAAVGGSTVMFGAASMYFKSRKEFLRKIFSL